MKNKKLLLIPTLILGASSISGCTMLCTVTWLDWDDTVLEVDQHVFPLEFAKYDGKTPERATTDQYTYKFAGWDVTPKRVLKRDTVFKAVYEPTLRSYEVVWKDSEGTILKKEVLDYGTTPSFTPEKESDAQYDYEFVEWDKKITPVKEDVTYTTTWKKNIRSYTVKWVDYNGTLLDTETYQYGTTPSFSKQDPVREDDPLYVYTFKGWATEQGAAISKVTGDVKYVAQYNVRDAEFYDVQLIVKNSTYETMSVREHENRTLPELLTNPQSEWCGYDVSWFFDKAFVVAVENSINDIVSDMKFYGQIPTEPHKFTITYDLGEGEANSPTNPDQIDYTQSVVLGDASKVGFRFLGWFDESGDQVTELSATLSDVKLTPKFEEATYIITFEENEHFDPDYVQEPLEVKFNEEPNLPTPVMKPGYKFNGWKNKDTGEPYAGPYTFPHDITLVADTEIIVYTITYNLSEYITTEAGNYSTQFTVENVDSVVLPQVHKDGYVWDHTWKVQRTSNESTIANHVTNLVSNTDGYPLNLAFDITLTPNLEEAAKYDVTFDYAGGSKQFKVNFVGGNETVTKTVANGVNEIEYFALEDKPGYQFAGWENFPSAPISGDITVNALWEALPQDYVAAKIGEETEVPFHNSNTTYCQFISLVEQDLVISSKTEGLYVVVDNAVLAVNPDDCKEENGVFTYMGTLHAEAGQKYVIELTATDNADGTTLLNIERANDGSILPDTKITAQSVTNEVIKYSFNAPMRGLPIPAKAGYEFTGWYKGEELFEEGRMLDVSQDFTLVAGWTEVQP